MKKIILYLLNIITIIFIFTINISAEEENKLPDIPTVSQAHYVIYKEGNRGNRIEAAVFDISDNSEQSLIIDIPYQLTVFGDKNEDNKEISPCPGTPLTITDNDKYCNDVKYYLDGDEWIYFEKGYNKISENATEIIKSDLPYIEKIRKAFNLNILNENIKEDGTLVTEKDINWDGDEFVYLSENNKLFHSNDRIHFDEKYLSLRENEKIVLPSMRIVSGNGIKLCQQKVPDLTHIYEPLQVYAVVPIFVLDENFNTINEINLSDYVEDIAFSNGYFYLKTTDIHTNQTKYIKTIDCTEFFDSAPAEYAEAKIYKETNSPYYFGLRSGNSMNDIHENIVNKNNKKVSLCYLNTCISAQKLYPENVLYINHTFNMLI